MGLLVFFVCFFFFPFSEYLNRCAVTRPGVGAEGTKCSNWGRISNLSTLHLKPSELLIVRAGQSNCKNAQVEKKKTKTNKQTNQQTKKKKHQMNAIFVHTECASDKPSFTNQRAYSGMFVQDCSNTPQHQQGTQSLRGRDGKGCWTCQPSWADQYRDADRQVGLLHRPLKEHHWATHRHVPPRQPASTIQRPVSSLRSQ